MRTLTPASRLYPGLEGNSHHYKAQQPQDLSPLTVALKQREREKSYTPRVSRISKWLKHYRESERRIYRSHPSAHPDLDDFDSRQNKSRRRKKDGRIAEINCAWVGKGRALACFRLSKPESLYRTQNMFNCILLIAYSGTIQSSDGQDIPEKDTVTVKH